MQAECLAHTMEEVEALEDAVAATVGNSTTALAPIGGASVDAPADKVAQVGPGEVPTSTFDGAGSEPKSSANTPRADGGGASSPADASHAWASAAAVTVSVAAILVM